MLVKVKTTNKKKKKNNEQLREFAELVVVAQRRFPRQPLALGVEQLLGHLCAIGPCERNAAGFEWSHRTSNWIANQSRPGPAMFLSCLLLECDCDRNYRNLLIIPNFF
jgi:hypothetical protein